MIEQALDTLLVLQSLPLIILLIYIFTKTRYNSMLIILGTVIVTMLVHLLRVIAITGSVIEGVYWFPTSFIYLIIPIIMACYIIKDKMWTLLSVLTLLLFTSPVMILILGIPSHGIFFLPMAAITWAWYKECGRCFNPIACPIMKLEGKYR